MKEDDLIFCEQYENKIRAIRFINILCSNITPQGIVELETMKKWVEDNTDKYLTITGGKTPPTKTTPTP